MKVHAQFCSGRFSTSLLRAYTLLTHPPSHLSQLLDKPQQTPETKKIKKQERDGSKENRNRKKRKKVVILRCHSILPSYVIDPHFGSLFGRALLFLVGFLDASRSSSDASGTLSVELGRLSASLLLDGSYPSRTEKEENDTQGAEKENKSKKK